MATTKKKGAKENVKKAEPIDFTGVWVSIKRAFLGAELDQKPRSAWVILPGNKAILAEKEVKCKVSKTTIRIPYSSNPENYWLGEMQPNGTLKISTSNKMMSYFCKRASAEEVMKK